MQRSMYQLVSTMYNDTIVQSNNYMHSYNYNYNTYQNPSAEEQLNSYGTLQHSLHQYVEQRMLY
jgi:hypothetical protein